MRRNDNEIQEEIKNSGLIGSQTDMPFHISIGSYETDNEQELMQRIQTLSKNFAMFDITLKEVGWFGSRVLFIQPEVNDELFKLRSIFNNDINKSFDWHAHATLFIDEIGGQFEQAKEIALKLFKEELNAKIVKICMGEFFPKRIIIEENLQKEQYEQKF